jgi:outer membrane lipoprotein-sorting protein
MDRTKPTMKPSLLFLSLATLWAAAAPTQAPGDAPADPAAADAILARLEDGMRPIRAVISEFVQERRLQLFAEPIVSEGVLVFEKPRRVRWETTAPYRSLFVADGSDATQFEWVDGQRRPLNTPMPRSLFQMLDQIATLHQGRLRDAEAAFAITVRTGQVCRVILAPKREGDRAFLEAMELHFAPDLSAMRAIVLRETNGDTTTLTIRREQRQPVLPARVFDTRDPADLETIRQQIQPHAP